MESLNVMENNHFSFIKTISEKPSSHRAKMSDYVPIEIMNEEEKFSDISNNDSKETKNARENNRLGCIKSECMSSLMKKQAIRLIFILMILLVAVVIACALVSIGITLDGISKILVEISKTTKCISSSYCF